MSNHSLTHLTLIKRGYVEINFKIMFLITGNETITYIDEWECISLYAHERFVSSTLLLGVYMPGK